MRLLGAVLAGGASRRFGSDKALASWQGQPLIEHVIARLAPQVAEVAVCGRDWPGLISLADRPEAGLGPLGGLAAALHHAASHSFDAVLSSGCDLLDIPLDLADRLRSGPAVVQGQPLLGLWPVRLSVRLDEHLSATSDRSLRRWVSVGGAAHVDLGEFRNVNVPADFPSD